MFCLMCAGMTFLCVLTVDVYVVFVVVEYCLFLESGCCLFCKWMKWMCGVLLSDS